MVENHSIRPTGVLELGTFMTYLPNQMVGPSGMGTEPFSFLLLFVFLVCGKWQPTPVFLPRESHGRRSLVGLQSTGSPRVGPD